MAAARSGHADVARLLLEHGADPNAVDDHGNNALMIAAGASRIAVMETLINHGADLHARNISDVEPFNGWTSLMHAAASGDLPSLQILISRSVDLNAQDARGETALMKATKSCNTALVEALLHAGAD